MKENEEVLDRASEILQKYRVVEIFDDLVNGDWGYEYAPPIIFLDKVDEEYSGIATGVTIMREGHELVLGLSEFEMRAAPDRTFYADAYIYFDEALVLLTGATKEQDDYYNLQAMEISVSPSSLEVFTAGPWLELLGSYYAELVAVRKQRKEDMRQKQLAEQAVKIDLGDY